MSDRRTILSVMVVVFLAIGSVLAAPAKSAAGGTGARSGRPTEFAPQIDGPITISAGPNGRSWAVWAYRASGEFDVAVAFRDGAGSWGAPTFVGRRDGLDEIEPTLAVDALGTVYLAFTTKDSGRIALTAMPAGSSNWLRPVVVSGNESASTPTMRVVGDHLVLAYRTASGVGIADFPVIARPAEVFGIQDGPDGVDPLGLVPKWSDDPKRRDTNTPPPVE